MAYLSQLGIKIDRRQEIFRYGRYSQVAKACMLSRSCGNVLDTHLLWMSSRNWKKLYFNSKLRFGIRSMEWSEKPTVRSSVGLCCLSESTIN